MAHDPASARLFMSRRSRISNARLVGRGIGYDERHLSRERWSSALNRSEMESPRGDGETHLTSNGMSSDSTVGCREPPPCKGWGRGEGGDETLGRALASRSIDAPERARNHGFGDGEVLDPVRFTLRFVGGSESDQNEKMSEDGR